MKFVLSATDNVGTIRKVLQLWDESGDPRNPFAQVLVSPLFTSPGTLKYVRDELKFMRNSTVYFDSGGYYVQQGRLDYESLYSRLHKFYQEQTWADWYVLPDHVPTSQDSKTTVAGKVKDTITAARMFVRDMSSDTKEKILPVVQGHDEHQIFECVDTYVDLGAQYIGFGSFGTSGATNQINTITDQSVRMLKLLSSMGKEKRFDLHLFGVSTPPILPMFNKLGVFSFDSMAWIKAAGYGNVFLPLVRGYMVTYRVYSRTHTYQEHFEYLKELTGHTCPFCNDFSQLTISKIHRVMHNLVCVMDTLDIISSGKNGFGEATRYFSKDSILNIIKEASPSYLRYYSEVEK
jgi:queuine/archaeosine tRNA-ribosyltransferase